MHFHWWAQDPASAAIHHQKIGLSPIDFATATVNALQTAIQYMNGGTNSSQSYPTYLGANKFNNQPVARTMYVNPQPHNYIGNMTRR